MSDAHVGGVQGRAEWFLKCRAHGVMQRASSLHLHVGVNVSDVWEHEWFLMKQPGSYVHVVLESRSSTAACERRSPYAAPNVCHRVVSGGSDVILSPQHDTIAPAAAPRRLLLPRPQSVQ